MLFQLLFVPLQLESKWHEYLPNESAASSLIELAKIYYLRNSMESAIQYAEQAIREPHLNELHRLNAYSLMCMSAADSAAYHPKNSDFRTDFNRFYAEREKVKEVYGRDDIYGQRVEILRCILDRNFDEALRIASTVRLPLTQWCQAFPPNTTISTSTAS